MSKKISELDELAAADVDAADVIAIVDDSAGETKRISLADAVAAIVGQSGKAIGEPFPMWDHIPGASTPDNSGDAKFIRLTAGQAGVGEYNEGLLTDEQVSGSAPLVEADAEIAVGPMAGQRVPLINTEMSFIRPGTSSGALQFDQLQAHRHWTGVVGREGANNVSTAYTGEGGTLSSSQDRRALDSRASETASDAERVFGTTSSPITTGASVSYANTDNTQQEPDNTNARSGGETRSKNRQATYYMRIV